MARVTEPTADRRKAIMNRMEVLSMGCEVKLVPNPGSTFYQFVSNRAVSEELSEPQTHACTRRQRTGGNLERVFT